MLVKKQNRNKKQNKIREKEVNRPPNVRKHNERKEIKGESEQCKSILIILICHITYVGNGLGKKASFPSCSSISLCFFCFRYKLKKKKRRGCRKYIASLMGK